MGGSNRSLLGTKEAAERSHILAGPPRVAVGSPHTHTHGLFSPVGGVARFTVALLLSGLSTDTYFSVTTKRERALTFFGVRKKFSAHRKPLAILATDCPGQGLGRGPHCMVLVSSLSGATSGHREATAPPRRRGLGRGHSGPDLGPEPQEPPWRLTQHRSPLTRRWDLT